MQDKRFSKEPIYVTSFMKNISKEQMIQKIMDDVYIYTRKALELNGYNPDMKAYRTDMSENEKNKDNNLGVKFTFIGNKFAYEIFNKKILGGELNINGTRITIDFSFYDKSLQGEDGTLHEFPKETVDALFEKDDAPKSEEELMSNLIVGGANFKRKDKKKEEKPKQEEPKQEPKPEPTIVHNRKQSLDGVAPKYMENVTHDEIVDEIYRFMDLYYKDGQDCFNRFIKVAILAYNYEYEAGDEMLSFDELSEKLKDEELFYDMAHYEQYF